MSFQTRCVSAVLGALLASGCTEPGPTKGDLTVNISGLPAGAEAAIRVTGPNDYVKMVRETETLSDLSRGDYVVRADSIIFELNRYGSPIVLDTVSISGGQAQTADVAYTLSSGAVNITVDGLPPNASPSLRLDGPGTSISDVPLGVVRQLPPGSYTLTAGQTTSIAGDRFSPAVIALTFEVTASLTPVEANVVYALSSATLVLAVNGLGSPSPAISVTGPSGFTRTTAHTVEYRGLLAGSYTVTASNANGTCPNVYTASQQPTALVVTRALETTETDTVTLNYTQVSAPASWLNLRIDRAHLVQVSQDYDGAVPMIAGKPALLRVFGVANQCNEAKPRVRVTLSNGDIINLDTIQGSVTSLPNQGSLATSWNVTLPAATVQPGLQFFAEIDPTNQIAESNDSDNRYPATNTASANVHAAVTLGLRLVPVAQSVTGGLTGDASNVDGLLDLARKIHPIAGYSVQSRPVYTTSAPLLQAGNGNGAWQTILTELSGLRTSESSPQYYYGVVKVPYPLQGGGVAGIGFIGLPAALGWDYLPSGSDVFAHELGHNFGRFHTPCGGPGGVDPGYPNTITYQGGRIGVFGYDAVSGQLLEPALYSDIMGYCNSKWISDYTYKGMLTYIEAQEPTLRTRASNSEQPSLLVWGRIVNGIAVLEPAFQINARPEMPSAPGPNRITALDANGAELFSFSFAGHRIADVPGDDEIFSFAVPMSALRGRSLASLRLSARGRVAASRSSADVAADPEATVTRAGPRTMRLRWNATRFPVLMVRDPVDGQILSFARGGDVSVVTGRDEVEINYSNKVQSARRMIRAR